MDFGIILPIITLPAFAEPQKISIDFPHKQENQP
jgi:hypothetical protein